VRFASSLATIENSNERSDATFTNGVQESFDLQVGADGVHSQTRKLILGPEQQFCHVPGSMVASYTLPDRYDIGQVWPMERMYPSRRVQGWEAEDRSRTQTDSALPGTGILCLQGHPASPLQLLAAYTILAPRVSWKPLPFSLPLIDAHPHALLPPPAWEDILWQM
jgi:2-polyprenyl-6-methoxyphenol hydroxylase-like FAD-dependent oxidoreductase